MNTAPSCPSNDQLLAMSQRITDHIYSLTLRTPLPSMRSYLVGVDGKIEISAGHPVDSSSWRRALDLGAVEIAVREDCHRLIFRPEAVAEKALSGAKLFLRELPERPVVAVTLSRESQEFSFTRTGEAACWLVDGEIENMAARPMASVAIERPLGDLASLAGRIDGSDDERLAALLSHWGQRSGQFDSSMVMWMLQSTWLDRTIVIVKNSDTGLNIEHCGAGLFSQSSPLGSHGYAAGPFSSFTPDKRYGAFIEAAYTRAIEENRPRFERVDAVVTSIFAKNTPPDQWRYDRLILPWRLADGRRAITSSSVRLQRAA